MIRPRTLVFWVGVALILGPWVAAGVVNGLTLIGAALIWAAVWNNAHDTAQHHARTNTRELTSEERWHA